MITDLPPPKVVAIDTDTNEIIYQDYDGEKVLRVAQNSKRNYIIDFR